MSSDRLGCDLNSYIDFDDGMPRSPFKVWALVWGKCNDPATAVIKKKNLPLHTVNRVVFCLQPLKDSSKGSQKKIPK